MTLPAVYYSVELDQIVVIYDEVSIVCDAEFERGNFEYIGEL